MQERQHQLESNVTDLIIKHLGVRHTITKSTLEDDINNGIDIYIDRRPYDLKCSNSQKITVFKKHRGDIYSPLLLHQDVPYLYVTNNGTKYDIYKITKQEILEDILSRWKFLSGSVYDGDGNVNANIYIGHFLDEAHLFAHFETV